MKKVISYEDSKSVTSFFKGYLEYQYYGKHGLDPSHSPVKKIAFDNHDDVFVHYLNSVLTCSFYTVKSGLGNGPDIKKENLFNINYNTEGFQEPYMGELVKLIENYEPGKKSKRFITDLNCSFDEHDHSLDFRWRVKRLLKPVNGKSTVMFSRYGLDFGFFSFRPKPLFDAIRMGALNPLFLYTRSPEMIKKIE